MLKIVINPTWRCQLQCPYCWVRALGWHTQKTELHWKNWAWWLKSAEKPLIVDFSGGEPLIYPGFDELIHDLVRHKILWAITTNLWAMDVAERLPIKNCVSFNVSYHPGSPEDIIGRAEYIRDLGLPAKLNVVEHPAVPFVPATKVPVDRFPYQAFEEDKAFDGITRRCNAGWHHLACDPRGYVYPCMVALQRNQKPLGTIAYPMSELRLSNDLRLCDIGCTTCYTVQPQAWELTMETVE